MSRVPYAAAAEASRLFLQAVARQRDVRPNELRVAGAVVALLGLFSKVCDDVTVRQVADQACVSEATARRMLRKLHDREIGLFYAPGKWTSRPSRLSLRAVSTGADLTAVEYPTAVTDTALPDGSSPARAVTCEAEASVQAEREASRPRRSVSATEKYRDTRNGNSGVTRNGNGEPHRLDREAIEAALKAESIAKGGGRSDEALELQARAERARDRRMSRARAG